MKLIIFGLTISSSWGNGHATLWRGLCRALARNGHRVVFFERDVPYCALHRDLTGTLLGYAVRAENGTLPRVLGGISPIDAKFITNMKEQGVLDHVDVVAVHGFPLDWNHWQIHEWPDRLAEIEALTDLPVWVTEVGVFTPEMGICQWFHFEDYRLDDAVRWLKKLGVKKLRTGLSWADSFRPNADAWFDHQMKALDGFDVTLTYCFTPEHCGVRPHHTSPPKCLEEYAEFCGRMTRRYS